MNINKLTLLTITLIFITAITFCGMGCNSIAANQTATDSNKPFYSDRVVTVRIVMSQSDWEYTQKNGSKEQYFKADMWFDGEQVEGIAIRPKGNSSLSSTVRSGSIRFSFKADLNFFNSARNLNGVKKLNFNNGFSDPTFIREVLGYDLCRELGLATPRCSFVDFWINDTHLGLYAMVEQIDATFLRDNFTDSNGNLYKPTAPAAYLAWTEEDLGTSINVTTTSQTIENINLGGGNLAQIMKALDLSANINAANTNPEQQNMGMPPQGMAPPDRQVSNNSTAGQGQFPLPGFAPRQRSSLSGNTTAPQGWMLPGGMQPPDGMMPPPPPDGMLPPDGMAPPDGMLAPPGGIGAPGMPGRQGSNLLQQMALKTNENKADYTTLLHFLEVLNNEPAETFQAEIEKVLDVEEALKFIAVSAVLVHLDNYTGSFGHNYYLYEADGKFTVIPWDLNMAFGTFSSGLDRQGIINFFIDEPTDGAVANRPLVARLLAVPEYLEKYHGYIREMISGPFSYEVMHAKIDKLVSMIRPYVEKDTLKFYSTEKFEASLSEDISGSSGSPGGMTPLGLKGFIKERIESIQKQLDGTLPSKSIDGSGNKANARSGAQRMNTGGNQ